MKTKSQIFKEAHIIAKTFEGDYRACFAEALMISYKNAKEGFTPDFVKVKLNPIDKTNPKSIFNALNGHFEGGKFNLTIVWNHFANEIFLTVSEKSRGFQADIAKKALLGQNISDKQKWCVAFEYQKVS